MMRAGMRIALLTMAVISLSSCTIAQAPFAIFTATPSSGEAPLTVYFDASGSSDLDGTITQYEWDFTSDGTVDATGATATYQYSTAGTFLATLVVTDNSGLKGRFSTNITVYKGSIFFSAIRNGLPLPQIFRMDSDGTNQAQITYLQGADLWPALSPNGRQYVAFARASLNLSGGEAPTGDFDIFKMLPDGSMQINLTQQSGSEEIQPTWSPDATKLAFASNKDGNFNIYTINADGTGWTRVTHFSDKGAFAPRWSPTNPNLLIFVMPNPTQTAYLSLARVHADGTGLTQLTNRPYNDGAISPITHFPSPPTWSPDGTKIAFTSDQLGSLDIFVMNADGSHIVNLNTFASSSTANLATSQEFDPFWLPNGTEIAFVSDRDGTYQLYKVNLATGVVTKLTSLGMTNMTPARSTPSK